ncbi:MAG: metalloregulator ArsR/SmtB family transcription factor [Sphaerochaetaceae bacterium]|nr:metalloregulator ArsR/SmtB family transcription factor [Sphaerochaetaceae bacterium]
MNLAKQLKALGDPTRLKIFQALLERKHCVRSLSNKLGITESAISQHLKVLKEASLVYGERYGYHVHYFPTQEALDFLSAEFLTMKGKSKVLDRDPNVCNCSFRRKQDEHTH